MEARDQVVTNCHVEANSVSISVTSNGESYSATAIKQGWHHDVCIVKVENLNASIANLGSSKNLKYDQPIFTIGYPQLFIDTC